MYRLILTIFFLHMGYLSYTQGEPGSMAESALQEYSSKEYYDHIVAMNKRSQQVASRGEFTYQLDSVFGSSPPLQIQFETLRSSAKYFFERNKDILFSYSCDGEDCDLEPSTYSIRLFDEQDRFVSRGGTLWDGVNYNYDCDIPKNIINNYEGHILRSIILSFNKTKDTLIYNDKDQLIQTLRFQRADVQDTFRLQSFWEYKYNEDDLLESIVKMDYRFNFSGFIPEDSTHYKYYPSQQLFQTETFFIEEVVPVIWSANDVMTYSYNNDGHIEKVEYLDLLNTDTDSIWRQQERAIYSYNSAGSLDSITYFDIRDRDNLRRIFRKEYTYDRSILLSDIKIPRLHEPLEGQQHMLTREHNYRIGNAHFVLNSYGPPSTVEYYYRLCDQVSTSELVTTDMELSPNPTTETIRLSWSEEHSEGRIVIYDTTGKRQLSTRIVSGQTIDVSQLNAGVHVLQLEIRESIVSKKFVKL